MTAVRLLLKRAILFEALVLSIGMCVLALAAFTLPWTLESTYEFKQPISHDQYQELNNIASENEQLSLENHSRRLILTTRTGFFTFPASALIDKIIHLPFSEIQFNRRAFGRELSILFFCFVLAMGLATLILNFKYPVKFAGIENLNPSGRSKKLVLAGFLAFTASYLVVGPILQAYFPIEAIHASIAREPRWLLMILMVTVAVVEELLFRKWLLGGFIADKIPLIWALIAHACMFSAGHFWQGLGGGIFAFCAAISLGLIYAGSRNVWICIALHGSVNLIAVWTITG